MRIRKLCQGWACCELLRRTSSACFAPLHFSCHAQPLLPPRGSPSPTSVLYLSLLLQASAHPKQQVSLHHRQCAEDRHSRTGRLTAQHLVHLAGRHLPCRAVLAHWHPLIYTSSEFL